VINEATYIQRVSTILDEHLAGKYKMRVLGRKKETAITMICTIAIIAKDGLVTGELISSILEDEVTSNDPIVLVETRIDLSDLDTEIILLEAEIVYLKD